METQEHDLEASIESSPMEGCTVEVRQVEHRKIAHKHKADKRANQRGPVYEYNTEVGRHKEEVCYESTYHVKNPGGLKINEKLYLGRVTVPECVANYLTMMDNEWERAERNLFRNTPIALNYTR